MIKVLERRCNFVAEDTIDKVYFDLEKGINFKILIIKNQLMIVQ